MCLISVVISFDKYLPKCSLQTQRSRFNELELEKISNERKIVSAVKNERKENFLFDVRENLEEEKRMKSIQVGNSCQRVAKAKRRENRKKM